MAEHKCPVCGSKCDCNGLAGEIKIDKDGYGENCIHCDDALNNMLPFEE